MSFFKRNKNAPLIPPVSSPSAQPSSDPYAKPPPYGNGGGGDPYARSGGGGGGDPYARSGGGGGGDPYASAGKSASTAGDNPYAKRGGEDNAARNELFAGYQAPEKPQAQRQYGYEGRETEEDFDEEEEVEGIKQEMRGLKQDSLASTRWVDVVGRLRIEGLQD